MNIQELYMTKNIIVQISWGEKTIEFYADAVDKNAKGIYVTPYMREGAPLELNISQQSGVVCNVFGNNPEDGKRVSWRNVDLQTVKKDNRTLYFITTSEYNKLAKLDERRAHERVLIRKKGKVWDNSANKFVDIMVNDVSDNGISFYAPSTYVPGSSYFDLEFNDSIKQQNYQIRIKCKMVYTKKKVGTVFYGCELTEYNRDYLLYGCLCRLMKNSRETEEV